MQKQKMVSTLAAILSFTVLSLGSASAGPLLGQGKLPLVNVLNLQPEQKITEGYTVQVRMVALPEVKKIEGYVNDRIVGLADYNATAKQHRMLYTFRNTGDYDLKIVATSDKEIATKTYRIHVVPAMEIKSHKDFNGYVLKAIDQLYKDYGWRGYNINEELTHNVPFGKYGVLPSSNGRQTMCVAGALEVITTAMNIYATETGDQSVFEALPYDSWRWIRNDTIKAHIWVDEEGLHSYGTADAVSKFGIGEHVAFRDLEPGMFMNLNYEDGGGHAVVFMNFLDAEGNDLATYDAERVKGFRYFGAQGGADVGKGGFSFRHSFFSGNNCVEVPYPHDCLVIYSDNQKILNTGKINHPSEWKHTADSRKLPQADEAGRKLNKKFSLKHWD